MSNETKRDVFEAALNDWKQNFISSLPRDGSFEDWSESLSDYSARYVAAMPEVVDDLPVIPKCVSEEIKDDYGKNSLLDELAWASQDALPSSEVSEWIDNNEAIFGEAWCRGLWIVKEIGEVTDDDAKN